MAVRVRPHRTVFRRAYDFGRERWCGPSCRYAAGGATEHGWHEVLAAMHEQFEESVAHNLS
jgi:hypothetical protein